MKKKKRRITLAIGVSVAPGVEEKMRKKKGSSNTGKYKNVKPSDFAGKSGGASAYSFPINSLARARNALARSHFAPDPEGIVAAVYRKFPQLKKKKSRSKSSNKK